MLQYIHLMKSKRVSHQGIIAWCACLFILFSACSSKKISDNGNAVENEIQVSDSVVQDLSTPEVLDNGVFKGTWFYRECPEFLDEGRKELPDPYIMSLKIDLYAKTIDNGWGGKTYGGFYVNNGFHEGGGDIVSVRIKGNIADIEYIDPAGLTCSAELAYNPETKQMTFSDGGIMDGQEADVVANQARRAIPAQKILEMDVPLKPHPWSARKGWGIYGNAEKVIDAEGYTRWFDKAGNILSLSDSNGKVLRTYYYDTKCTKYTIDGWGPYIITYGNHKRSDMSANNSDSEGDIEYVFDEQGRVIERKEQVRMIYVTETFAYSGTNILPDSRHVQYYDETGASLTTDKYEYLEADEKGNWLKRKVIRTSEVTEYVENGNDVTKTETEPARIETQTIEYFD